MYIYTHIYTYILNSDVNMEYMHMNMEYMHQGPDNREYVYVCVYILCVYIYTHTLHIQAHTYKLYIHI